MRTYTKAWLRLLSVLAALSVAPVASACYDPGVQRWITRDPVSDSAFILVSGKSRSRMTSHRLRNAALAAGGIHELRDTDILEDGFGFRRVGDWATSQSDSRNLYSFVNNSPVIRIDSYGLRMRTAFPRDCCELDDAERIDKALTDLKKDWKYTQRYPEKGYMDALRGGCNGARRALDLISRCFGPFTPQQQAQFQRIRDAVEKYCGGDDPDADQ